MRTPYDFASLSRSSIGFERLFDLINASAAGTEVPDDRFPPYDIARTGEDSYRITLAIAGFSPGDVSITAHPNLLTVAASKPEKGTVQYVYRGIASQEFTRQFNLADHVEVSGASYDNGLLHIDLVRRIPEAMKPRSIPINAQARNNGKAG
jgi:molecular chaperone IbpA